MQTLPVAAGDRLLIRGRHDGARLVNGDFRDVASVDPVANRIVFTDGRELPPGFAAWTYGHAIASYRSQGATAEESLLVLGEIAAQSLNSRQFYVGNTRFRGAHAIYVSDKEAILERLCHLDRGRELATEFVQHHWLAERQQILPRPIRRLRPQLQLAWLHTAAQQMEARQREGQHLHV